MNELPPCPFCGSTYTKTIAPYSKNKNPFIECDGCGCVVEFSHEKELHRVLAKWSRRASPWISVKDQLPEQEQMVIALTRHGVVLSAELLITGEWMVDWDSAIVAVTHWMPIPPAPENSDE